jgi:hypothetical protein
VCVRAVAIAIAIDRIVIYVARIQLDSVGLKYRTLRISPQSRVCGVSGKSL